MKYKHMIQYYDRYRRGPRQVQRISFDWLSGKDGTVEKLVLTDMDCRTFREGFDYVEIIRRDGFRTSIINMNDIVSNIEVQE